MNLTFLHRALAATVLLAPLACAAQQPDATANEQPQEAVAAVQPERPDLRATIKTAAQEVEAAVVKGDSAIANLERLRTFRHSASTTQAFKELLGTEHPWTLEKRSGAPGGSTYRWRLNPARYTLADGTTYSWSALPVDLTAGGQGRQVSYRGAWPAFAFEDKLARISLSDITFKGATRAKGDLWFSNVEGTAGTMRLGGPNLPSAVTIRQAWMKMRIGEQARGIEYSQSYGAKAVEFGAHRFDNLKFAYRFANIDKATLMALVNAQKETPSNTLTPDQQLAAGANMMQLLIRSAMKGGTAVNVDMSGAYQGHKVQLRGQFSLDWDDGIDLADKAAMFKRVNGRLNVRLPLALVRVAATAFAGLEAGRAATRPLPQELAKQGRATADALVRQLLDGGFARLEQGVLVTTVELRSGVLRANGKEIPLQQPGKDRQPASGSGFVEGRRQEESCTLPEYPAEVVEKDLPLTLELGVLLGPDGVIGEVTPMTPSQYPEYDKAVLAAFPQCRYSPGVLDGQPVESTLVFTLTRVPGSKRP